MKNFKIEIEFKNNSSDIKLTVIFPKIINYSNFYKDIIMDDADISRYSATIVEIGDGVESILYDMCSYDNECGLMYIKAIDGHTFQAEGGYVDLTDIDEDIQNHFGLYIMLSDDFINATRKQYSTRYVSRFLIDDHFIEKWANERGIEIYN